MDSSEEGLGTLSRIDLPGKWLRTNNILTDTHRLYGWHKAKWIEKNTQLATLQQTQIVKSARMDQVLGPAARLYALVGRASYL